jgi:hypothetical protein
MPRYKYSRKVAKKVARLSYEFERMTRHYSFTCTADVNYKEMLAMGPKIIPSLLKGILPDKDDWVDGDSGWRFNLISDIANRYKLPKIEKTSTDGKCLSLKNDFKKWALSQGLYNHKMKSRRS